MADDHSTPNEPNGPDEAALALAARHALHDEELVAALAIGSLDDEAEQTRARSFIDRCAACRSLHDDVAAIGAALKVEARGTVPAPRDFRLTVDDARRLGGTVSARGFLDAFRRSMASFARPVGASMAALGIVGLLVGSVSLGGSASMAGPTSAGAPAPTAPAAASSGAVEFQGDTGSPADPRASGRSAAIVPSASGADRKLNSEAPVDGAATGVNPAAWLLVASALLVVVGIAFVAVAIRRSP